MSVPSPFGLLASPGGPRLSAAEVAEWVESKLAGREPEGSNGLRYTSARVTALSVMEER